MSLQPRRVMLILSELAHLDAWLQLAAQMMPPDGQVLLRALVSVEAERSISEGASLAREWREALEALFAKHPIAHDEYRVIVDHQPFARVLEEIAHPTPDLLIVQWMGPYVPTGRLSTEDLFQRAPCNLVLLHGKEWHGGGRVLLSLRGGPNLTLGLQVAKALSAGDEISLLHVLPPASEIANLEVVMSAEPQVSRSITLSSGVVEGVTREVAGHKAVVLGAGLRQLGRKVAGVSNTIARIFDKVNVPLALVSSYIQEDLQFHAPQKATPEHVEATLSQKVDRWFAENTFHSNEFADLRALLDMKERQGLSISVGLPALNEEGTVGEVISILKKHLMDDLPLVDELVLIDSNSTDRTVEIAESLGVPVYKHPQILPEVGTFRGKGEALWKSLHVLKGDIIAWVDTDITNMHPRFIYGIIGPLLKYPHLQYVKGFYQRPIQVGDSLQAYGGGRVTELVARPMFNLFYPELSGIIQPLSGEYAGRRKALERVPFYTGYGVETALLIDLLTQFGLEALAQTDLEVRVHHNQPLVGLSKMAFALHQVFIERIEQRYGAQLLEQANRSMKLIVQEPERFGLEVHAIRDIERPPILEVDAYRQRHPTPSQSTEG